MAANWNAFRWDGAPGHYEVYYLSLTDPASGVGAWIRYTMVAPQERTGEPATCALWFMAMDPDGAERVVGRKATFPIERLVAESEPFRLDVADATLTDRGMAGAFGDVRWELAWEPRLPAYEHVHPFLRRAGIAKTVLFLPHADLEVSGTLVFGGRELALAGARGGQAHLWGSKHAGSWAWAHCNDFATPDGEPVRDTFVDGVSVFVPRFGRQVGPSTPLVARVRGEDFASTSPVRVLRNQSTFGVTSWRFEARDGARKLVGEVDARREDLVGVTYHDPDGDLAYCYNSEIASMRVGVWDRSRSGWELRETLVADGRAHFEYAQREPLPDLTLHVQ